MNIYMDLIPLFFSISRIITEFYLTSPPCTNPLRYNNILKCRINSKSKINRCSSSAFDHNASKYPSFSATFSLDAMCYNITLNLEKDG